MLSKTSANYQRPHAAVLARRLAEPRRFIQVVAGPRQVGKTTLVQQVVEGAEVPVVFASADEPTSSPKLQVMNTALIAAQSGLTLAEARTDHDFWGRLVESAVGAHLANAAAAGVCEVFYWRERGREVDFVVRCGRTVTAIEVKSGRSRESLPGMAAFVHAFKPERTLLVGGDGIPVEEFLLKPVEHWVKYDTGFADPDG